MARKYSTGTGVWGLDIDAWSNKLSISLPPFEEQQSIAKILSDLVEKIDLNNEMNKTLEDIALTIFKRWFIDFEFPPTLICNTSTLNLSGFFNDSYIIV